MSAFLIDGRRLHLGEMGARGGNSRGNVKVRAAGQCPVSARNQCQEETCITKCPNSADLATVKFIPCVRRRRAGRRRTQRLSLLRAVPPDQSPYLLRNRLHRPVSLVLLTFRFASRHRLF
jgi:hypothetical protein